MQVGAVVERVERISTVRADVNAGPAEVEAALHAERQLRAWLDASAAELARRLKESQSFPESTIADASQGTLGSASKTLERSETLDSIPDLASALDDGAVTAGHVDAVTRAGKSLDAGQRAELHDQVADVVDKAGRESVSDFGKRVRDLARNIERSDGMDRLDRQKRATSVRTWTDGEGMWNLRGRFDPITAAGLAKKLDDAVNTLFAETVPESAPADPAERQAHLRAHALARLMKGKATAPGATTAQVGTGRPEYLVVVNADEQTSTGEPFVDWAIPVEVPWRVVAELAADADVHAVVVRNGVVLYAPGELNLGRTTRLANRAQRRALRALYSTCAIPGCSVGYDYCRLHHIIWWRHGGRTDLDNLLPVCTHHHTKIHHDGWNVALGPNRELTLTLPDGTIHNTGPPRREAA